MQYIIESAKRLKQVTQMQRDLKRETNQCKTMRKKAMVEDLKYIKKIVLENKYIFKRVQ